jgi:ComF family protein
MDAWRSALPILRLLGDGLLQLVYPAVCQICLEPPGSSHQRFCSNCRASLEADRFSFCWRCGSSVGPHEDLTGGCVRCRSVSFHFSRVIRLGVYEGLLRDVVLRMKSQAGESLAWAMGDVFAKRMEGIVGHGTADGVLAIPLHWWKRASRGYNQSEALGRSVASHLRLPYLHAGLVRIRRTPPQVGLTAAERRHNVCGAFAVRRPHAVQGKRLLLLDDVMTTSSTASEVAGVLRRAGAAEVMVGVLAHRTI